MFNDNESTALIFNYYVSNVFQYIRICEINGLEKIRIYIKNYLHALPSLSDYFLMKTII